MKAIPFLKQRKALPSAKANPLITTRTSRRDGSGTNAMGTKSPEHGTGERWPFFAASFLWLLAAE